jgi:hypothetical protein
MTKFNQCVEPVDFIWACFQDQDLCELYCVRERKFNVIMRQDFDDIVLALTYTNKLLSVDLIK